MYKKKGKKRQKTRYYHYKNEQIKEINVIY